MDTTTVTITVNGERCDVPRGTTIVQLIEQFQEMDPDLLVELNGRFIYPRRYPDTVVKDRDRVELVHPHFGG